jgi:hypothetical protein
MKNEYEVKGEYTIIYSMHKGDTFQIIIDTEDLPKVIDRNWNIKKGKSTYYARAGFNSTDRGSKHRPYMHSIITECPSDLTVDHADFDGLNNRKGNLSIKNREENSSRHKNEAAPRYTWDKNKQRYRVLHRKKHIKWCKTEEEAKEVLSQYVSLLEEML